MVVVRARFLRGRLGVALLPAVAVLVLGGCPREPAEPPPPVGPWCATVADCNGGQVCGLLAACVDHRCERGRSLEVPCPP